MLRSLSINPYLGRVQCADQYGKLHLFAKEDGEEVQVVDIGPRFPFTYVELVAVVSNNTHIFTLNKKLVLEIWDAANVTLVKRL